MLDCQRVTFAYANGFRLGPIDVSIDDGITCLVGANGAGKSTLFHLLTGELRPRSGKIDTHGLPIGFLPQQPSIPRYATCEEFLTHVAWLQGIDRKERARSVSTALQRVGLAECARSKVGSLSGGMKRRLGIAQAIIHNPRILLLDEPTVGLDPLQRIAIRDVLRELSKECAIVVSTHLVEDVKALAERVLVLSDGKLVFDDSVSDLEAGAPANVPGETPLERALAQLMGFES